MTSEPVMILTWNLDDYLNLRRNMQTKSEKFDNDVILANHNVIIIFLIYC